ncbi:hypothetical protein BLAT2472_20466 [Burkholderia latens]
MMKRPQPGRRACEIDAVERAGDSFTDSSESENGVEHYTWHGVSPYSSDISNAHSDANAPFMYGS